MRILYTILHFKKTVYFFITIGLMYLSWRVSVELIVSSRIDRTIEAKWILFLLSVALVLLMFLAFRSVLILIIERRKKLIGSMIKTKLSVSFFLVTIVPVILLSIFIAFLINTGIKAVYRPSIEKALNITTHILRRDMSKLRKNFKSEVRKYFYKNPYYTVRNNFTSGDYLIKCAGISRSPYNKIPEFIKKLFLKGQVWSRLVPLEYQKKLFLIYILKNPNSNICFMCAELPEIYRKSAPVIISALREYRQIRLLRNPLQVALVYIVLLFVIMLTLLVLIVAMRLAKNISEPIKALAKGTRRVAEGNLDYRVKSKAKDELSLLVDNFNTMTDELQRSQQRLFYAEKFAAWQEVAKRLAHEIKNPLTPIKLAAERVLRQSEKNEKNIINVINQAIPAIITEVDVIQQLVDEFASFARLPKKNEVNVEVNNLIRKIIDVFIESNTDITFSVQLLSEPLRLMMDRNQMRRAIGNLVNNSINALRSNTEQVQSERHISISLEIVKDKGGLLISIKDKV